MTKAHITSIVSDYINPTGLSVFSSDVRVSGSLSVQDIPVSVSGHNHSSSDINNFNSSVSGLLPVTSILAGSNITINQSGTAFTVAVTGSLGLTTEEVDDRVASLLISGNGINLNYNDNTNTLTISSSGLQPSGNYSTVGHTHSSSDISDFSSSVSGLFPTIANSGDNRLLTSTGSSIGINAENNATFDGTTLAINGAISVDNLRLDGNTLSSASGNIIINPSGTGALQRDSSGNARGQYAVDWQTVRSNATMVAGGNYSVIGGGSNNTSSSIASTVGGGSNNTSIGIYSTVGGGELNTSSNTDSTVGGGISNTSSGMYSIVGGGYQNTSSGSGSAVGGGSNNTSSGQYSTVGGGRSNTSSGNYSISKGFYAVSTMYGQESHASGRFAVSGDAQKLTIVARRATTNNTANQVLFLDGSSNRLIVPAKTSWVFVIKLSAYNDTDNQSGWWIFRGGIRRNASNGTVLVGSLITESGFESSFNTASTSVVADDTNEALEIRVTGVASKNIRWVAVVDISQVSY